MRRIISISICTVVVLLVANCRKDREEVAEQKIVVLKPAEQLEVEWQKLDSMSRDKPELEKEIERLLDRYTEEQVRPSGTEALQRIYSMIRNPDGEVPAAREALRLFVKMNATEVVRESLLHKNRDVVIIASDALVAQTEKNAKNEMGIPYLIHVLAQNNYIQEGSEDATIHTIMKHKLIKAIQKITNLDIKVSEINVDHIEEVERVLSLARAWAKQRKIKLFEK